MRLWPTSKVPACPSPLAATWCLLDSAYFLSKYFCLDFLPDFALLSHWPKQFLYQPMLINIFIAYRGESHIIYAPPDREPMTEQSNDFTEAQPGKQMRLFGLFKEYENAIMVYNCITIKSTSACGMNSQKLHPWRSLHNVYAPQQARKFLLSIRVALL